MLTTAAPGKWAGKEGKHVPLVSRVGERVTVTVNHPMSAAEDHWTEWIFATDAAGTVVAAAHFAVTDPAPPRFEFDFGDAATSLTVYAYCNKHGLWRSA